MDRHDTDEVKGQRRCFNTRYTSGVQPSAAFSRKRNDASISGLSKVKRRHDPTAMS